MKKYIIILLNNTKVIKVIERPPLGHQKVYIRTLAVRFNFASHEYGLDGVNLQVVSLNLLRLFIFEVLKKYDILSE